MREFRITNTDAGRRLDRWLALRLPHAGTGFLYKMLRKKNITLNDRKTDGPEVLETGDVVKIWFSEETYRKFAGEDGPARSTHRSGSDSVTGMIDGSKSGSAGIPVLYEDEDVLIIDKPAGLLSQKAKHSDVSIRELTGADACHRLDRNTSGVLVCGKTYRGLRTMTELIRTRAVKKEYLCLVHGRTPEEMELRDHLLKDVSSNTVRVVRPEEDPHAKEALLKARTLAVSDDGSVSLLEVRLETGRSHQIRVQMAHAGHPLLGDVKYGDPNVCGVEALAAEKKIRRPMLHAYALTFPEGVIPDGTVAAPVPNDMKDIMKGAGIAWPPGIPED